MLGNMPTSISPGSSSFLPSTANVVSQYDTSKYYQSDNVPPMVYSGGLAQSYQSSKTYTSAVNTSTANPIVAPSTTFSGYPGNTTRAISASYGALPTIGAQSSSVTPFSNPSGYTVTSSYQTQPTTTSTYQTTSYSSPTAYLPSQGAMHSTANPYTSALPTQTAGIPTSMSSLMPYTSPMTTSALQTSAVQSSNVTTSPTLPTCQVVSPYRGLTSTNSATTLLPTSTFVTTTEAGNTSTLPTTYSAHSALPQFTYTTPTTYAAGGYSGATATPSYNVGGNSLGATYDTGIYGATGLPMFHGPVSQVPNYQQKCPPAQVFSEKPKRRAHSKSAIDGDWPRMGQVKIRPAGRIETRKATTGCC